MSLAAGGARLAFARGPQRTDLVAAAARSPTRLLTPRNHGHARWVYTSSFGGGLVSGDEARYDLDVGAGATAVLLTQASTKVYRSPRPASQTVRATVGAGACLAILPDPVVCFAGARFCADASIRLGEGASLVWLEVLGAGRVARGERWAFDSYASRLRVEQGGALLAHEATELDDRAGPLGSRFGAMNLVGTLLVAGPAGETLGPDLRAASTTPRRGASVVAQASTRDGVTVLRFAAERTEDGQRLVARALAALPPLLGDDPFARRA